jgi:anaerobic magnesium-protoporphyrin IX monomethyl ester cyclase
MSKKDVDILLIFPPLRTWDRPRNFPCGTGLIAARLRKEGYKVGVIDVNGLRWSHEQVMEKILTYNTKVIGIGGMISVYRWVRTMTGILRERLPETKIILGGSVGTSIIDTALRNLNVDVISIAEADDTILELLPAMLNSDDLKNIRGLAYLEEDQVVKTAARPQREDLNSLPYPAWDLFPMETYLANPVVGVGRDIDIISSRGCPYPCQYCYRIFGRQYRGRSAENVVGEMLELYHRYNVDFISFQDDCFVIDKKRVHDICDMIDSEGMNIRWSCTGRVNICDLELLKRMKASGCVSVSFGLESGSNTILQRMKKNTTTEKARKAIENCRQAGLRAPVSFMTGYPGENIGTMMETVEYCKELNIPLTALMITCPYPGTPLYDEAMSNPDLFKKFLKKYGKTASDGLSIAYDEEQFVLEIGDAVDLTINLSDMSDDELLRNREDVLEMAKNNYVPPTEQEVREQEIDYYGLELYERAKRQMETPEMQAHRKRHGFNAKVG